MDRTKTPAPLSEELAALAQWIHAKYQVLPKNILAKEVDDGAKTRIMLVFQDDADTQKIYMEKKCILDPEKHDAIASKYEELIQSKQQTTKIQEVYIVAATFNLISPGAAYHPILIQEIEYLKNRYKEQIWHIMKTGDNAVDFFFHTEAQLALSKTNNIQNELRNAYISVLKRQVGFEEWNASKLACQFDSKENLDKNYDGNWYYYYK